MGLETNRATLKLLSLEKLRMNVAISEHRKTIETSVRVEFHAIPPWVHVSIGCEVKEQAAPKCQSRVELA